MSISNEFVLLNENDMFQVNGGGPISITTLVVGGLVVCAVIFVASVAISAYNSYKEMERQYGK